MELGFIFISMCAIFFMLQSVRAVAGGYGTRSLRRSKLNFSLDRTPSSTAKVRLHWADTAEISRLIASDPELVIFRLIEIASMRDQPQLHPGYLSVTLKELKETLPWIPHSSRIAIYRMGGIDSALVRRLSAVLQGRDVLLLKDPVPPMISGFQMVAGEPCN